MSSATRARNAAAATIPVRSSLERMAMENLTSVLHDFLRLSMKMTDFDHGFRAQGEGDELILDGGHSEYVLDCETGYWATIGRGARGKGIVSLVAHAFSVKRLTAAESLNHFLSHGMPPEESRVIRRLLIEPAVICNAAPATSAKPLPVKRRSDPLASRPRNRSVTRCLRMQQKREGGAL